jgi:hypothetical protein
MDSAGDSSTWDRDPRRFTANKLTLLERIQDDPNMGPTALSVAFVIVRMLNRERGCAWPSQATIGSVVGVKPRQVRNVLRHLEQAGYLRSEARGYQKSDRYFAILTERKSIAALGLSTAMDCQSDSGNPVPSDRRFIAANDGAQVPPNPCNDPIEGTPSMGVTKVKAPPQPDVQAAFDAYNHAAKSLGLPTALKLDDKRRKAITAILKDYGIEGWNQALANLAGSAYHLGRNDGAWKASLGFLTRPDKFLEMLERGTAPAAGYGTASPSYLDLAAGVADQHSRLAPGDAA